MLLKTIYEDPWGMRCLSLTINHINSEAASKTEQRFWQRFFSVTIDRDQIAQWEKDLDRVIALFNFEAIVRIATGVEKLVSGLNTTSVHVLKYHPTEPPSRPAMLYGHDGLVAELTNLVINDEHLALISLGGMGKSSVAKAIINEPLVMEKFADQRFFATYDDLDPSTITFRTFMTRFARALGIEIASSDPVHQISTFLHSASALVVLDNAETLKRPVHRCRRNAPHVQWITKDIPPLDLSSAQAVFFQIYHHASRSEAKEDIKGLLGELDFHPLSINILANAAQQNGWSPTKLLKRWNDQHSKLSLSSPSVQHLGEDGLCVLAIIAFLPQGLNEDLASDLLPSLPQVDAICDVLCMHPSFIVKISSSRCLPPFGITCKIHCKHLTPRVCKRYVPSTIALSTPVGRHTISMLIPLSRITLTLSNVVAFNLANIRMTQKRPITLLAIFGMFGETPASPDYP
ncbi:hypothetical protein DFJ58DRAFT_748443 [Suillus subalutaceus]|uniref:uncharacterized protein n=1 Tax=Suillus subalutaceus TaxID=48586 RepID=UPI001B86A687|nr:uncharacterized protein DFJ58DRAFT_748443 [Suillus subalutaceus]KAG1841448.1 hypothetical protein DFJ58DRAFT_748443 [Suillus subalutaceus]